MEPFTNPKTGRPRMYTFTPVGSITDPALAMVAAMLQELRARVIDQINDLPMDALSFQPQGSNLSIGVLVIHLVWAEAGWMSSLTGCSVPAALRDELNAIGQALPAGVAPPASSMDTDALVAMCCRIDAEVTVPALAKFSKGLEAVIKHEGRSMTPQGVLMHLIWHWAYHSGHIGLLREQWGGDYTWTFGSLGAG